MTRVNHLAVMGVLIVGLAGCAAGEDVFGKPGSGWAGLCEIFVHPLGENPLRPFDVFRCDDHGIARLRLFDPGPQTLGAEHQRPRLGALAGVGQRRLVWLARRLRARVRITHPASIAVVAELRCLMRRSCQG